MTDPSPLVPVVKAEVTPPDPPVSAPLVVTVAANRRTGSGMNVTTQTSPPDIIVKVVQPLVIICVRALRVFLQTLLGLLSAGTVAPKLLPAADFMHLLGICASLSVAATVVCVIQNAIELLAALDQKFPTLSA
jgi:hypothetical protein